MKAFKLFPVVLFLVGLLMSPSGSFAAKKHYLDRLAGNWKGKGIVITSAGAKEEAIRCRLNNRSDSKKPKISITGNCAISSVIIPMTGWIKQTGNSQSAVDQ